MRPRRSYPPPKDRNVFLFQKYFYFHSGLKLAIPLTSEDDICIKFVSFVKFFILKNRQIIVFFYFLLISNYFLVKFVTVLQNVGIFVIFVTIRQHASYVSDTDFGTLQ